MQKKVGSSGIRYRIKCVGAVAAIKPILRANSHPAQFRVVFGPGVELYGRAGGPSATVIKQDRRECAVAALIQAK